MSFSKQELLKLVELAIQKVELDRQSVYTEPSNLYYNGRATALHQVAAWIKALDGSPQEAPEISRMDATKDRVVRTLQQLDRLSCELPGMGSSLSDMNAAESAYKNSMRVVSQTFMDCEPGILLEPAVESTGV